MERKSSLTLGGPSGLAHALTFDDDGQGASLGWTPNTGLCWGWVREQALHTGRFFVQLSLSCCPHMTLGKCITPKIVFSYNYHFYTLTDMLVLVFVFFFLNEFLFLKVSITDFSLARTVITE